MLPILKILVLASMLFSLLGLGFLLKRTFSLGKKNIYAKSSGSPRMGVWTAFTTGMMPWKKESAKNHLITYLTGVIYHVGIFFSFLVLLSKLAPISIPNPLIPFLRSALTAGLAGGLGLLFKRMFSPAMKFISNPDDYASNLIVTSFLAAALVVTHRESWLWIFYLVAMIMFFYIPLGKIRHCIFFFYTRILFGRFHGRRGIMPFKSNSP